MLNLFNIVYLRRMKRVLKFIKDHPLLALMYLVSVALLFVDNESGVMMAMAAGAVPEMSPNDPVPSGSPTATPGISGANTQVDGQATTVSNVAEAAPGLIEPDIDEDIISISSEESVIDTIKRRVKRQVLVKSFEVDHYLIDEKPANIVTSASVAGDSERATIAFEKSGGKLVKPYYTIVTKDVKGYLPDGKTQGEEGLMLVCTGTDTGSGNPVFMAVNGPKDNTSDEYCKVPAIPEGTTFLLCASMAYETQKHIAPSTVVPVPERMFLQKQLCNSIVSDYFKAQKKRIPFAESVIAEAIIRQYRLESCRTAWFGVPSKIKLQAQNPSLGEQFAYSSKGLRWQFKRMYDKLKLTDGKLLFETFIDMMMNYFTSFNSSKKAVWLMGKELLAAIQKIDFQKQKDITMGTGKVWGVEVTKLKTVFGEVSLVHDPTLDAMGYTWEGGLIDENGLVRYYMKNESQQSEKVEGEEAKRDIVMTIDCLCLKGLNHMWVDGSSLKPAA